jgi:hypothetical protein
MKRPVRHLILWIIALLLVAPSYALPQNVFNHCGLTGDAKPSSVRELNKLKNRFDPPADDDIAMQASRSTQCSKPATTPTGLIHPMALR